jgi:hypothetical protein
MTIAEHMSEWIRIVPTSAWTFLAGLVPSLITLWVTSRAARRTQLRQLAHDRDMRKTEREMALRKEIFLGAAEALTAGLHSAGRYLDLSIAPDVILKPYSDRVAAFGKVNIVGNLDTVTAVAKASLEVSLLITKAQTERLTLEHLRRKVTIAQKQTQRFAEAQTNLTDRMREADLEGDGAKMARIQRQFDGITQLLQTSINEQRHMEQQLHDDSLRAIEQSMGRLKPAGIKIASAIVAVRRELDLPIEEAGLVSVLTSVSDELAAGLGQLTDRARELAAS